MEVIEEARIDSLYVCLHMYLYIGMYSIYTLYTYVLLYMHLYIAVYCTNIYISVSRKLSRYSD